MKRISFLAVIMVSFLLSDAYPSETVRYILAVGANNGGGKRETLRFAVSDAQAFSKIMNQLGGVPAERTTVLVDPRPDQFALEFSRLEKLLADDVKRNVRTEVIFYYSGHSDEEGLLLGKRTFTYTDLRDRIRTLPSDVKIAILDSCSSGAFTRVKGGKMLSPFMNDSSQNMRGFAFMTSSSADEVSQESDRIGGSFFTHYLISGLRGAADGKHDGRITLNEVYQYAYRETLSRTARTIGGAQHPNYNIQMTGTGDVILTDIRSGGSLLTLSERLDGRFFVNNGTTLVSEFSKEKGDALSLSLPEGRYSIVRDSDGNLSETRFAIRPNVPFLASEQSFTAIEKEESVKRGGKLFSYVVNPFAAYLFPLGGEEKTKENFQLYLIGGRCSKLEGFSAGVGVGIVTEDMKWGSVSAIGSVVGGDAEYLQAATIFSYTGKTFRGLQGSAVCSYTGRDFYGVQGASVCSFTSNDFRGIQGAAAGSYTGGDFYGVQSAAGASICGGSFTGVQGSAVFNMTAGDFRGVQGATVLNIASGDFYGVQCAIINYSGAGFTGFQPGLVNIAKKVDGCQLGLVNVTDYLGSGVQLGLVNYSKDADGIPIGLFSIVKNGETYGNLITEENGFTRLSLAHGSKKIYNILSWGYNRARGEQSSGIGWGHKFEFGDGFLSVEGIINTVSMSRDSDTTLDLYNEHQLKLTLGYSFFEHCSIYGGVSLNHYVWNRTTEKEPNPPFVVWRNKYNKIGPGFFIGYRF